MAGLKPIGSEKLEGLDKIKRIIEISRYNEHLPQAVNENESKEYSLDLADGNNYEIVRERQGYIIKKTLNESETDYIEPIQNRKYFSSYSQALKKLNLMAKEFNTLYENTEGTSLFNEQKKKYKLKVRKPKADLEPVAEPAPAEAPAPAPVLPPAPEIPAEPAPDMGMETPPSDFGAEPPMGGEDMGMEPGMGEEPVGGEDMGMEEPPMDDEMGGEEEIDVDIEDKKDKGVGEFKRIQILVGKLAQKIRQYEEEKDLSAKDVKYIINSILSSLDVEVLDEDDIEQIITKLEGEEDEDEETSGEEEIDVDMEEEMPTEEEPEEPELAEMDFASLAAAQGEVTEYDTYGDAFGNYMKGAYTTGIYDNLEEDEDMVTSDYEPEEDEIESILQKMKPYDTPPMDMEISEEDDDLDMIVQDMKRYDRSPETKARKHADMDIKDYFRKGGDFRSDDNIKVMKKTPIDYDVDFSELDEEDDENYKLRRRGARVIDPRKNQFAHGTFNESKIDKVLEKYFVLTESEKSAEREEKRVKQEERYRINQKDVITLSESTEQLKSALWYIKHNPESRLMGLSNKGNMIFKEGLNDTKITKSGEII